MFCFNMEPNTFKFKSFTEYISDINLRKNAFYRLGHHNEETPGENETWFHQTLQHWSTLNLTDDYVEFFKKYQQIATLPQLVLEKDTIVKEVIANITKVRKVSLRPFLEILIALAKDLRDDFYQFFENVIESLILICNSKDPEVIEWTFLSVACLFKVLRTYLKRDFVMIFHNLLALLQTSKQPVYIVNYIVECIAFLARGLKDHEKLISTLITYLKSNFAHKEEIGGRIVMETVRGVKGQFNSCAENLFQSLVSRFFDNSFKEIEILVALTKESLLEIMRTIQPRNMRFFLQILANWSNCNAENITQKVLEIFVDLIQCICEFKSGYYICVDLVVPLTLHIADKLDGKNVNALIELSNLASTVLLSKLCDLPQLESSRLMRKISSCMNFEVLTHFALNVCNHEQFEVDVLPNIFSCFCLNYSISAIHTLAKIALNKKSSTKINIPSPLSKKMFEVIKDYRPGKDRVETEMFILIMYVLSQVELEDVTTINSILQVQISKIFSSINTERGNADGNKNIFILYLLVDYLILSGTDIRGFSDQIMKIILPHCRSDYYTCPLKIICLLIGNTEKHKINNLFDIVHKYLSDNLCSPNRVIRSLTARILCESTINKNDSSVYRIMLEVETIDPNIASYREQLGILRKLSTQSEIFRSIKDERTKIDCLKFCLGLLFHNFTLIWDETLNLIEEYSKKLRPSVFWNVFNKHLEYVAEQCVKQEIESNRNLEYNAHFDNEIVNEIYEKYFKNDFKANFISNRMLLWKNIPKYGTGYDTQCSILICLFSKFFWNEYKPYFSRNFLTWNLLANENKELDVESDIDSTAVHIPAKRRKTREKFSQEIKNTLITKLEALSKLNKAIEYLRSPEVANVLSYLLKDTDTFIQKLSLDCILILNEENLTPYKTSLYNIIDESKMKAELIKFRLDKEASSIREEHRSLLIPMIFNILYGKVRAKGSSKQINSQTRKILVLKSISGCESSEILSFLSLLFECYENILEQSIVNLQETVLKNQTLSSILTAKKLSSSIKLAELLMKCFGCKVYDVVLNYIIKILIAIGTICDVVLTNAGLVKMRLLNMYSNVKYVCLLTFVSIFEQFHEYDWQEEELDAFYNVFIWPSTEKIVDGPIHSPTPLLKLFSTWCYNPKYLQLLLKNHPETKQSCLSYMLNVFYAKKVNEAVYDFLLNSVEQILLYEDQNIKLVQTTIEPYFSVILDKYVDFFNKKDNSKASLKQRDLNILSKICANINQNGLCGKILNIFLPLLLRNARKSINSEEFTSFFKIIEHVLITMDNPEKFVPKILALFEHISDTGSRRLICETLRKIEDKGGSFSNNIKGLSSVAAQLNAVDNRWFDQADYEKRLRALRRATEMAKNKELSFEIALTVVYNCFFFLKNEKDIGMRNNCNDYLKQIIPSFILSLAHDKMLLNLFVNDVILNTLKELLRNNDDNIVRDAVQLLGHLARTCSKDHCIFRELALLSNSADLELDFFENLTHLQTHRHGRALLRYVNIVKDNSTFSVSTLTQIILPLCTRYLYNERFGKKHTLVDAAIEAVGATCRLLPWHQYYTVLRYYLSKMRWKTEFHKQSLRILMVVLDAFHFDLSKGKIDTQDMLQKPKKTFDNAEKNDSLEFEFDPYTPNNTDVNARGEDMKLCHCDTVLPPSTANHVVHVFSSILIPSLNNSITNLSEYESSHKSVKKKISAKRENEETLRVPLALAVVKLLQKLPNEVFSTHIPGVLMKVCAFLKSPLKSVRMFTRDVLKKIILSLGPKYLSIILEPLFSLLTRGFQVHVLSVTVHGILDVIKDRLTPTDIGPCLSTILRISLNDIFGEVADEKEVYKIGQRTPEAKTSIKSYLVLNIISEHIESNCLIDIITLFKEYLSQTHSKKIVSKMYICFQKISHGLVENKNISPQDILTFIYGLVSENIDNILKDENSIDNKKENRQDCLIMQCGIKKRNNENGPRSRMQKGFPLFIEFALNLLHLMIKRRKVCGTFYEQFLNPLVPTLNDLLENSSVRISTLSINCVTSLLKAGNNLENLKMLAPNIKESIFRSLHKYFSANITLKDENYALVKSTFKALVVLVRKSDYCNLNSNDLNQLFYYVDQYINGTESSSTGFSLLKSILSRKLNLPEIHDFMKNLCDIAITSTSEKVREESRSILLFYITGCKQSKKVNKILKFFVNHLKYETPSGRLSAIAFLLSLTKKLKLIKFRKRSEFLYMSLSTRLVNEALPECRIAVAQCIEAILLNIDEDSVSRLFDLTLLMLNSDKPPVREMAAMLCSRFVETKKENFYEKSKKLLEMLMPRFNANEGVIEGKYVLNNTITNKSMEKSLNTNQPMPHELIQIGNCIIKIHEVYPKLFEEEDLFGLMDQLAYNAQKLLNYNHEWVRLNSVKILNCILQHYDHYLGQKILQGLSENVSGRSFIYSYPREDIRSICLDMCAQLKPNVATTELSNEIVKVLLRLAQMIKWISQNESEISLLWLIRRMQYIVHAEVVKTPQIFLLRSTVLKWIDGLLPLIDKELLQDLLPELMIILQRELAEENANTDKQISAVALRICSKIRKQVNDEIYDNMWAMIQRSLLIRKARKRKAIAQEKILNPLKAAKRKRSRTESKQLIKRKKNLQH